MQLQTVPKYQFKAKALAFLRMVQEKQEPILVTHNGDPVIKISPFKKTPKENDEELLKKLANSITYCGDILSPVGVDDWDALK